MKLIIMETTKAVVNPAHDGRKKHGWQAMSEFPKGTRFALSGSTTGAVRAVLMPSGSATDHPQTVSDLLSVSIPSKPISWREIALGLPGEHTADSILDALVTSGAVTQGMIASAIAEG